MRDKNEAFEKVWDYLEGKLSNIEEIKFEGLLKENSELRKEVEKSRKVLYLIHYNATREKLKDRQHTIDLNSDFVVLKYLKIAAAILIASGIGWVGFNYFSNLGNVGIEKHLAVAPSLEFYGNSYLMNVDSLLSAGEYEKANDYLLSINKRTDLRDKSKEDIFGSSQITQVDSILQDNYLLLKGYTLIKLQQGQQGISVLDSIRSRSIIEKGQWLKALVYIRSNNKDLGKIELERIMLDTNSHYYNEAKSILKEIKD